MRFNEKFSVYHAWLILDKMIADSTDNETFFVNNTRYFLAFSLLKNEYHLLAFLPHRTLILAYSHETKQYIANNFVGECFAKAFEQTTITVERQEPKLVKNEIRRANVA